MTILEYFFKAFDCCRKKRGLSQKQVSEFVGINENDMSRYRNAKRGMDDDLKAKVASFFGYELLDFLALGRGDEPAQAIKAEKEVNTDDINWKERYYEESEAHKRTLMELNQVRKELDRARKELAESRQSPTASGMETAISISLDD